jgi:putative membrane-bound dehydrogenase-like protein
MAGVPRSNGLLWGLGLICIATSAALGQSPESTKVVATVAERKFVPPAMTPLAKDLKAFEYVDADVAYYPPGGRSKGDGQWNRMQLPLAPAESLRHYSVPQDFHLELFAAEPQIGKPITMAWDERGRLWIAETVDYPNELQPPGQGRDRIRICEDTDGDGRADRFTVFAEQLSIPTSLTFSRGGVIVHQAPQTLWLADTDGDDRADERRVLFEGWSTADTHAGPNNLRYGLDNWIWGMQGYAGFEGEVGGQRHGFKQGFYRFRPDGSKLEFLRSTNNNTWGIGFSEEGIVFGSTANRNPSVYMPIANRYYERVRGWSAAQLGGIADTHLFHSMTDQIRQVDHHQGYTAAAGHALYTARAYPKPYWNQTAFVCEPTGHLVGTFVLEPRGSDFRSHNPANLLASDDQWAAPIMAEVGPDGQVWVIDWYNYIVQHNPTPAGYQTGKGNAYETSLRDKKHGRIYRIVYGDKHVSPSARDLSKATPEQLVAELGNDNLFWRRHAQRRLVERGKLDVAGRLIELIADRGVDEIGLNVAATHALWTLHGLELLDGSHPDATVAALAALDHPAAGVRRNALLVLPLNRETLDALLAKRLLEDADAQVRLAALLVLSDLPYSEQAGMAIANLARSSEMASDRWLADAMTSAAAAHDRAFLAAVSKFEEPNPKIPEVVALVAEHYARGAPLETVSTLLQSLTSGNPQVAESAIAGLAKGWPRQSPPRLSDADDARLVKLLDQLSPAGKGRLLQLAARWESKSLEQQARQVSAALTAILADDKQSERERIGAARQLIGFRTSDAAAVRSVLDVITARTSPSLNAGLFDALRTSEADATANEVIERLAGFTPVTRSAALALLIGRANWTSTLLEALDRGQVALSDLSLDQKQALTAHPDFRLANRARRLLERGGSLPNADRQQVLEELLPLASRQGDVEAGKQVFKKHCAKCHTHSGEGAHVGPDLTGMAVHPKAELLAHLIDPSRSVEGNYRVYTVATVDGLVLTGLLASETRTSIELFDAEAKQRVVLREDIDQLIASSKSLMPEGFEKQVSHQELTDLLEFLTTKGRFLPLPLAKAATAVSTRGMFHAGDNGPDRLIFSDWGPKTASGVPFQLVDPRGGTPNVILLHGPSGTLPPKMPSQVTLACHTAAKAIHLLSGISGWGYPLGEAGSVSMIVRLHYQGGETEDHPLRNGEHFADYIRRIDVPGSQLAFMLGNQQLRYLAIEPRRDAVIEKIDLVKGSDRTAPIVVAVTVETR